MRSLAEPPAPDDRAPFPQEDGVFADDAAFAAGGRAPARAGLAELLGVGPECHLVYVGQQVCADMGAATAAKFVTARDAAERRGLTPAVLWHDMDSTQSERYGARIVLPGKKTRGVWLAPRELEDREPRFIPIERERLEAAVAEIA